MAKSVEGAKDLVDRPDHLGWLTYTFCPGRLPPDFTLRLSYTLGSWEQMRKFTPDQNGIVALGNGSQFNGVGQDLEGKAFFAIAVDMKQDAARQYGVAAVTKDGRELTCSKVESGGGTGQAVQVQRFRSRCRWQTLPISDSTPGQSASSIFERIPAAGQGVEFPKETSPMDRGNKTIPSVLFPFVSSSPARWRTTSARFSLAAPGQEAKASANNREITITAPPDVMIRVQTFITVMDWPDKITRSPTSSIRGTPSSTPHARSSTHVRSRTRKKFFPSFSPSRSWRN